MARHRTRVRERGDSVPAAIDQPAVLAQAVRRGVATAGRLGQAATRLPELLPGVARAAAAQMPEVAAHVGSITERFVEGVRALIRRLGLTDFGLSVLLLGLACAVVGYVMSWRELLLIGGGCLAAVVVAVAYTLAHAEVTATLEVTKSRLKLKTDPETAGVTVVVTNTTTRGLRPLRIEIPCGDVPWSPRTPGLAPGRSWQATQTVPALRRGIITVGPVSTVRADPLGLFRHEAEVEKAQEIIVYPRTVNLERLGAGLLRDLEGHVTKDLASHDLAFHALRPYVPGDERRHIHWRTSARTNMLMVRQFVDTRSSHLAIVVSGSKSEYASEEEFETALSVGASISARASTDSQTVSVLAAGHTAIAAARQRLLDPFARAQWDVRRAPKLADLTQHNARRVPGVSVGILIAGSVVEPRQFQQAAVHFGAHVKIVGIRVGAHAGGRPSRRSEFTVLNVARLEELPRVLRVMA